MDNINWTKVVEDMTMTVATDKHELIIMPTPANSFMFDPACAIDTHLDNLIATYGEAQVVLSIRAKGLK